MKSRFAILFFIVILSSITCKAQFIRSYGIKAGSVAANQTWDYVSLNDLDTKARFGFVGGVFLEMLDVPYISVVAELDYIQKGFKYKVEVATVDRPDGTGQFITHEPSVDYLSIPIMGKLRFEFTSISPYLIAGPRLDILIKKDSKEFDAVFDKFSETNIGATIGAGAEINLINIFLFGEIRYSPTLQDDFNNDFLAVRNKSVEFILGIGF